MTVKPLFSMEPLVRSATVLAAALVAWVSWYLGIGWFNGGEGLEWLHGFQWGALPASAAIAVGCAAAVVRDYSPSPPLRVPGAGHGTLPRGLRRCQG